jgi:pimeloyl-ACP methyl ester carboxylesterase
MGVALSPDARWAVSTHDGRDIRLWEVASGKLLRAMPGHTDHVIDVTFSPDGRHILSASLDETLRLWDAETGQELRRFQGGAPLECVACSPDGHRAVSGGWDGFVRLWDLESGKQLRHLRGYGHKVAAVAFSADGRRVVSGGHDGMVRLWDAETGQELCRFAGHREPVWSVAFSADGRLILSGGGGDFAAGGFAPGNDWALRLWEVPQDKQTASVDRPPPFPAAPPFVILGHDKADRAFNTLDEAVAAANDFDTIEVRGNGLFLSSPIFVRRALTIRAGLEPSKSIQGIWQGSLKAAGSELRLAAKISGEGNALTGTLDSVDQGVKGLRIEEVTFKNDALRLNLKGFKAGFEGKMSKDGNEIAGHWKQGGLEFPLTFKRVAKVAELNRPQEPKPPYPYAEEEVVFENNKAGVKLAGTLTLPRSKGPFPVVLLITGSGPQDRDETLFSHKPFKLIADDLTRRGIAVLRVDDRGVGKSTGIHGTATTSDFAEDVEAGVAYLKSRLDINAREIGLLGHSEGGIIAPMVAARSKDIAFIVMLAGTGVNGEQVLYYQGQAIMKAMGASARDLAWQRTIQEILFQTMKREPDNAVAEKIVREAWAKEMAQLTDEEKKEAQRMNAAMDVQFKRVLGPWFRFFLTYEPAAALKKVQCPVLALNGEKDLQVDPKQNLAAIAAALKAGGNKDFTTALLPGLNHLFQTCKSGAVTEYGQIEETMAPAALERIATWVVRHTTPVKK